MLGALTSQLSVRHFPVASNRLRSLSNGAVRGFLKPFQGYKRSTAQSEGAERGNLLADSAARTPWASDRRLCDTVDRPTVAGRSKWGYKQVSSVHSSNTCNTRRTGKGSIEKGWKMTLDKEKLSHGLTDWEGAVAGAHVRR